MLNASFQQNPFDYQSNELTIMQLWFILCDDLDFLYAWYETNQYFLLQRQMKYCLVHCLAMI